MSEIDIFQRLISISQTDVLLNLPSATLYQNLVDTFLSDGYNIIPACGWWKPDDYEAVIDKRTSPKWDIAWKVDTEADKTALFELEDAGYLVHIIHEIGGENVWFISLHAREYHAVKELQKRAESAGNVMPLIDPPQPKPDEESSVMVFFDSKEKTLQICLPIGDAVSFCTSLAKSLCGCP